MSEEKTSFMAELDQWSEMRVIAPIADAYSRGPNDGIFQVNDLVKKAIREKVLESYRNGQAAGPRTQQRRSYGKR